jgi:hypothetical protein
MSDGLRFALGGNATGGDVGCDRRTDLLQWRRGCGEEGLGGSRRSEDAVELGGCAEAAAPGDRGSGHDGRRVCCSRRCCCAGSRLRWSMACDAQRELERARRCCGAAARARLSNAQPAIPSTSHFTSHWSGTANVYTRYVQYLSNLIARQRRVGR